MDRSNLFHTVFLILLTCCVQAQGPAIRFESLSLDAGASNGSVNCILQDSRGFLWFGTYSGLVRFDGYKARVFPMISEDGATLRSDQISCLYEDREQRLWVGTLNAGLFRYDRRSERFENFRHDPKQPNSLSHNEVYSVCQDSEGLLWVGTKFGLNRFDPQAGRWKRFFAKPAPSGNTPISDHIYEVCETPDGSIWAATTAGLYRYTKTSDWEYQCHVYPLHGTQSTEKGRLADNFCYIVRPAKTDTNTLWAATRSGLKKITYSADPAQPPAIFAYRYASGNLSGLSHPVVQDFWETPQGDLWVGSFNGLNLLKRGQTQFRHFFADPNVPFSLSHNTIRSLWQDRSNNLWIGTESGLNKVNLGQNPFIALRPDLGTPSDGNIVSALCADRSGKGFWAGTRTGGLHYFDAGPSGVRRAKKYRLQIPWAAEPEFANVITGLAQTPEGDLWISTQGAGVVHLKPQEMPALSGLIRPKEQYMNNFGYGQLADDYVMCLHRSARQGGRLWIGHWGGGIDLLEEKTAQVRHFRSVGNVNLTAFANVAFAEYNTPEGETRLWVGTRGNGLLHLRYDEKNATLQLIQQYAYEPSNATGISDNKINCLHLDRRGRLWVGGGAGVNLFSDGKFRAFDRQHGLPDNAVQSILEDRQGQLWVSTENGLACLREKAPDAVEIRQFNVHDGLHHRYFFNNSAVENHNGTLAFGGMDGLTLFDPAKIRSDTVPPLTALSDFKLFNRSVPVGQPFDGRVLLPISLLENPEIRLSHRDNVLTFEFVSLHFSEPLKNKYAYKLEGFDQDWVYTDAGQRYAHYTNLPYRNFVFRVKSSNGDGVWSEPVSVRLHMDPPIWLSKPAFVLYALLFVGLLYAFWRIVHLRAAFKNRLTLERLEREKTAAITQAKLQFFTNISHELRTPLTLILSPLEQLLHERPQGLPLQKMLARMHEHAEKLSTMINQLLDFQKSEAGVMPLHVEKTDLPQFVEEVALSFKSIAQQHRIALTCTAEQAHLEVWIDRDQMEKVLFNLLSNALKFTPDEGAVHLRLGVDTEDREKVYIAVSDTGPGIPAHEWDKIFTVFHQVDHQAARSIFGGTGIGLALVKAIMEQHKGCVSVKNGVEKGAVFTLVLQTGTAHFTTEQLSPPRPTGVPAPSETGEPVAAVPSEAQPRKLVLIADDNPGILAYLHENLSRDYDVCQADNGADALRLALDRQPALVISDIAMPGMDGLELCHQLKTQLLTCHIPVVLLTARAAMAFKRAGWETGADDYITKPFNMPLLLLRVRSLLHNRDVLREKYGANSTQFNPAKLSTNPLDKAFLTELVAAIDRHLDESEYAVDDLARDVAMSRPQLYRKVKALTGDAPNALIRNRRLQKAAELLASGQHNVSEVAYRTGFTDLKYFRERFKDLFGSTPSEYRDEG